MFTERTADNEGTFRDCCGNLECAAKASHFIYLAYPDGSWNVLGYACEVDLHSEVTSWRDHYRPMTFTVRGVSACRIGSLPHD